MPNLFLADMVREVSSSTGTGAFTLDGPAPGHRAFASAVPNGATFPYAICGVSDESQWETGEGQLSPTGQLIRTPKASSATPITPPTQADTADRPRGRSGLPCMAIACASPT